VNLLLMDFHHVRSSVGVCVPWVVLADAAGGAGLAGGAGACVGE